MADVLTALVPGPTLAAWASAFSGLFMLFVYLDEFGHVGPYFGRRAPKYNEHPAFGLAGYILPESAVRPFASFFLDQKKFMFQADCAASGQLIAHWEKKGSSFIRPGPINRYPEIRRSLFRIINRIDKSGGKIFYQGRVKIRDNENVNPNGLHKTVFSQAIRKIDEYANSVGLNFVIVMDQHSAHRELLITAEKTMFGTKPTRKMISPPFEVVSSLNQNIQCADWLSTLIGKISSHEIDKDDFSDNDKIYNLFKERIKRASTHSGVVARNI